MPNAQFPSPPRGLESFIHHVDGSGRSWWLHRSDGWEVFARPVGTGNPEEFPMYIGDPPPVMDYGVELPAAKGASWELRTNSDKLSDIILDSPWDVETATAHQLPPWDRPAATVTHDFGSLALPAAILGGCIFLAVATKALIKGR